MTKICNIICAPVFGIGIGCREYANTWCAKKIISSLESLTIDPSGSSPGLHLKRKISPCTGLEEEKDK